MFADRADAGERLAEAVAAEDLGDDVVVLGLPRGGVPVASVVAKRLAAPLDVLVVRKLGAPENPEFAIGAIGPGGIRVVGDGSSRASAGPRLERVEKRERAELARREQAYRAGRPALDLAGRTVVIVDDGVATGATARVACLVARALGAARVILAVPVAPATWRERLGEAADTYVAVEEPRQFWAVGAFYRDFRQTSDDEVIAALRE
jgi:predicted phosphoribosyltransferase